MKAIDQQKGFFRKTDAARDQRALDQYQVQEQGTLLVLAIDAQLQE